MDHQKEAYSKECASFCFSYGKDEPRPLTSGLRPAKGRTKGSSTCRLIKIKSTAVAVLLWWAIRVIPLKKGSVKLV